MGLLKFKPFLFVFSLIQSHSHRSGSSTIVATYMVLAYGGSFTRTNEMIYYAIPLFAWNS
jgi:hypothetical protein